MKKNKGITLISLVVTIIVLLILVGVSINLITGSNGIISKAENAVLTTRYANYVENFEIYLAEQTLKDFDFDAQEINALNENVLNYISNLDKNDIGKFAIILGKIYFIGTENDEGYNQASAMGISIIANINDAETMTMAKVTNSNEKLGVELRDKSGNSTDWKIVTEVQKSTGLINKKYGTGYYYIKEGTNIPSIGVIQNAYIINYSNNEVINTGVQNQYSYTYLDINSTLGVGGPELLLNMDSKSLEQDENGNYNWGTGVILKSTTLADNEIVASNYVQNGSFVLDGTNYLEIYNDNGYDFSDGITFEVYGNIEDVIYDIPSNKQEKYPLFSLQRRAFYKNYDKSYDVRFNIVKKSGRYVLFYNLGSGNGSGEGYDNGYMQNSTVRWNIYMPITNGTILNQDSYITLVIDPTPYNGDSRYIKQTTYYMGNKVEESYLDLNYWNNFLNAYDLTTLYCGRGADTTQDNKYTLKGEIYAIRAYNKALTAEEVMKNYNATISYHGM